MSSITNSTYTSSSLYYELYSSTETSTLSGSSTQDTTTTSVTTSDTVTFSAEVSIAQTREAIGLSPTGTVSREDFETLVEEQEEVVSTLLSSIMEELGIDADTEISLTMDEEGVITVNESFTGNTELEAALNENSEFVSAFQSLSACNEFLDYTETLQSATDSLADYVDADDDWDGLLSLASQYSTIKSAKNSLGTLLNISKSETPYTYVHNSDSEET